MTYALISTTRRRIVAGLLIASGCLAAHAVEGNADAEWARAQAAISVGIGDMKGKSPEDVQRALADREERIRTSHLAFFQRYPRDERRWDAALQLLRHQPRDLRQWPAAKAQEWEADRRSIREAILAAWPTLPLRIQERYDALPLFDSVAATFSRLERDEKVDWAELRVRIDRHLERYAAIPTIAGLAGRYMGMYERAHSAEQTLAEWRSLAASPVVRNDEQVRKRLDVLEREIARPFELAFVAADGRVVDFRKLRGKVVLIDFWATWCGPCIAELPNVKRVYEAFRDQGFEVVGVALENADLRPSDDSETTEKKHAAARRKLLDFASAQHLPWPQYYDGRYWNNAISRDRFQLNAVPSTFLIDRDGMIAAVNVRGPQLEHAVRRLLAP